MEQDQKKLQELSEALQKFQDGKSGLDPGSACIDEVLQICRMRLKHARG